MKNFSCKDIFVGVFHHTTEVQQLSIFDTVQEYSRIMYSVTELLDLECLYLAPKSFWRLEDDKGTNLCEEDTKQAIKTIRCTEGIPRY